MWSYHEGNLSLVGEEFATCYYDFSYFMYLPQTYIMRQKVSKQNIQTIPRFCVPARCWVPNTLLSTAIPVALQPIHNSQSPPRAQHNTKETRLLPLQQPFR